MHSSVRIQPSVELSYPVEDEALTFALLKFKLSLPGLWFPNNQLVIFPSLLLRCSLPHLTDGQCDEQRRNYWFLLRRFCWFQSEVSFTVAYFSCFILLLGKEDSSNPLYYHFSYNFIGILLKWTPFAETLFSFKICMPFLNFLNFCRTRSEWNPTCYNVSFDFSLDVRFPNRIYSRNAFTIKVRRIRRITAQQWIWLNRTTKTSNTQKKNSPLKRSI